MPAGIRDARGFALNGTHYDSTERQIRFAADISKALGNRGIPGKYAVIDTAENGRPFKGYEYDGPNFDNARACTKADEQRCVTLGIPPTIDVDSPEWGLPEADRKLADRYVDAYLWFGRPWPTTRPSRSTCNERSSSPAPRRTGEPGPEPAGGNTAGRHAGAATTAPPA